MSRTEQWQIAAACTAVIAAAIEDVVAEYPGATPAAQARRVVRALAADGWHISAGTRCASLHASPHPPDTTPPTARRLHEE